MYKNQGNMFTQPARSGLNLSQTISFGTFIIGVVTIWIHLEIRIAEINVEIVNLKQDQMEFKSDTRKNLEIMRGENSSNARQILDRVDEIQIYLRNRNSEIAKWRNGEIVK
jgi:hypothetical protein